MAEKAVPYGTGRPTFFWSRALSRLLTSRTLKIRDTRGHRTRSYRTATIREYDVLRSILRVRARSFDISYVVREE